MLLADLKSMHFATILTKCVWTVSSNLYLEDFVKPFPKLSQIWDGYKWIEILLWCGETFYGK